MAISYPEILTLQESGRRYSYTDRETLLYALAIGFGVEPQSAAELPFIYEKDLRAVPTLATVVAWGAGVSTERLGLDLGQVLHGEEETILHRPMPPSGRIVADSVVLEVYDKGKEKGAIIVRRTVLRDEASQAPIATLRRTLLARGDGGCGGAEAPPPSPHATPARAADLSLEFKTRADQAVLYRLCGDRNPLHVDPRAARAAGFEAPILHGLCTYGITCRAVLQAFCNFDPGLIASHAARFSSPVYPGDTLKVDLWRDGDIVSFQASVPSRGVTAVKNGKTVLRAHAWRPPSAEFDPDAAWDLA
jgi:acyl dehydratase